MDDGVLDYTFPLVVDGKEVPGLGSTGQQEIINLAFMIVARQYLNIVDYPLYLDEVGMHLDVAHRIALMNYINAIKENRLCSHIFMVNHYTDAQSALSNYNVIVLDDRNIVVPAEYNQHTRITHSDL
jgi:recombinational DNA repair ATPase RecF